MDAIVEAAARLLAESGRDGASTTRIARVAGVSIGSLYQYFPGKDAIATALIRRQAAEDVAHLREAIAASRGLPLEERLERIVDLALEPVLARPRLFVFILTRLPELDLLPVARDLERQLAAEMRRLLEEHPDELSGIDPVLASYGGVGAMRGALIALVHHAPEKLEQREPLARFLKDVVLGTWQKARGAR